MCPPWWILEKNSSLYYLPKVLINNDIQLLEEGWFITDNMEIANIFNKHFIDDVAAHVPILYAHACANHHSVSKISQRSVPLSSNETEANP